MHLLTDSQQSRCIVNFWRWTWTQGDVTQIRLRRATATVGWLACSLQSGSAMCPHWKFSLVLNPAYILIRELQAREPSKTLTLNAGDYFQGIMWYNFSWLEKQHTSKKKTTRSCTIAPSAGRAKERDTKGQKESQRERESETERAKNRARY